MNLVKCHNLRKEQNYTKKTVTMYLASMKSLESQCWFTNKKGGVYIRCDSVCLCLRRICSHCSAIVCVVIIIVAVNDNNKFNVSLVESVQHKSSAQSLTYIYVCLYMCMCVGIFIYVYLNFLLKLYVLLPCKKCIFN